MDKNFLDKLNESYDEFHLKESKIKKGDQLVVISPKLKLILGWSIFALCVIFGIIIITKKPKEQKKDTKEDTKVEINLGDDVDLSNEDPHSTKVPYEQDSIEELNTFFEDYYTAMTACNYTKIQTMVTNPDAYIDDQELQEKSKFITGYNNITVYTKTGLNEGDLVAFVVANVDLTGVNSSPYDIHIYYIVNGSRGYAINNNEWSKEIKDYVNDVTADKDIQKVFQSIKKENEKLADADPSFATNFYDIINNPKQAKKKKTTEEAANEETQEAEEAAQDEEDVESEAQADENVNGEEAQENTPEETNE